MLLNKANIPLTGSSVDCSTVSAGAGMAPPPSSLFAPPSSLLLCLPSFSVVFPFSSWRVFVGLGCTEAWELGEEDEAQLEPYVEGPRSGDRAVSDSENRNRAGKRQKNERGVYSLALCTQCFVGDFRMAFQPLAILRLVMVAHSVTLIL